MLQFAASYHWIGWLLDVLLQFFALNRLGIELDGGLARLCETFQNSWGNYAHNVRAWRMPGTEWARRGHKRGSAADTQKWTFMAG